MASGLYSADEVRRWVNQQGLKVNKQGFLNLIRNPAYIGKIRVKAYGNDVEQIVMGIHPPIVTDEIFYRANEVLAGRKRNMIFHQDKTDLYPLKGFMKCPLHGTALTAYGSMGRHKVISHYYLCTKCGSEQRHRIKDVHQSVEDVLSTVQFNAQTLKLYKKVLEKVFDKEDFARRDETEKVKQKI
jgi:hypothetical protein